MGLVIVVDKAFAKSKAKDRDGRSALVIRNSNGKLSGKSGGKIKKVCGDNVISWPKAFKGHHSHPVVISLNV